MVAGRRPKQSGSLGRISGASRPRLTHELYLGCISAAISAVSRLQSRPSLTHELVEDDGRRERRLQRRRPLEPRANLVHQAERDARLRDEAQPAKAAHRLRQACRRGLSATLPRVRASLTAWSVLQPLA